MSDACLSLLDTTGSFTKKAEPIEMPWTLVGPKTRTVLGEGLDLPAGRDTFGGRHLGIRGRVGGRHPIIVQLVVARPHRTQSIRMQPNDVDVSWSALSTELTHGKSASVGCLCVCWTRP